MVRCSNCFVALGLRPIRAETSSMVQPTSHRNHTTRRRFSGKAARAIPMQV